MNSKNHQTVWETQLPLPLVNRGKVRDIYEAGKEKLLIVTTDRLSAFDVVLPSPIPDKGRVLNQISLFWFKRFKKIIPNQLIASEIKRMGFSASFLRAHGESLRGRSILVHRAEPLPVECVVRGFLAGSGWKDYGKSGAVCGHALRAGLKQCQELPRPIFTPATKAKSGHDLNIDYAETTRLVGKKTAKKIKNLSLKIYSEGVKFAKRKGILIADTKFEFGIFKGKLILIDEVLTPDSSRFWPKDKYEPGRDQPSLDKQIVRNFLLKSGWDQTPPGPALPTEIIKQTSKAYKKAFAQLTGRSLE